MRSPAPADRCAPSFSGSFPVVFQVVVPGHRPAAVCEDAHVALPHQDLVARGDCSFGRNSDSTQNHRDDTSLPSP